jgi:hypothetical protein
MKLMDQAQISFTDKIEILMRNVKPILHSSMTFDEKKQTINSIIEKEARSLALKNGLPISFFSFLSSLPLHVVGRINPERTKISGNIVIMINSRYIRANESYILASIFHEYCHFLMEYITNEINQKLEALYSTGILPFDKKGREESFCNVFGVYIVKGTSNHPILDKFVKNFIEVTVRKINEENWMYRISDDQGTIVE